MISNTVKQSIEYREGADIPPEHYPTVLLEGKKLLSSQKFEELDGCLGDQGCHLRAIPTARVALKQQQNEKLEKEEEDYVTNMIILGKTTIRLITENGIFLEEKTKEDFPECLAKDKKYSQRIKGRILYSARNKISKYAINQLQELVEKLPDSNHHPRFNCDLKTALLDSFSLDKKKLCLPKRENEDIDCLPYLTAGLSILETLLNEKIGLLVVVKRYKITLSNEIEFENCACLPYEAIDGKFCYIPDLPEEKHHVPNVTFEFYSFYHESDPQKKSFFKFIDSLTQMDIYDLTMMNWSVHAQYPHVRHEDSIPSYFAENSGDLNKIYENYKKKAEEFNITQEKIFVRKGNDGYIFNLEDGELPWFTLNHIYCSNYVNRTTVIEELRSSKNPVLPKTFTYVKEHPGHLMLERKIIPNL